MYKGKNARTLVPGHKANSLEYQLAYRKLPYVKARLRLARRLRRLWKKGLDA